MQPCHDWTSFFQSYLIWEGVEQISHTAVWPPSKSGTHLCTLAWLRTTNKLFLLQRVIRYSKDGAKRSIFVTRTSCYCLFSIIFIVTYSYLCIRWSTYCLLCWLLSSGAFSKSTSRSVLNLRGFSWKFTETDKGTTNKYHSRLSSPNASLLSIPLFYCIQATHLHWRTHITSTKWEESPAAIS